MEQTKNLYYFRIIAILEGISFLILMGIGMPLKYIYHQLLPLKILGWAHGLLFIFFIVFLIMVRASNKWNFKKVAIAFIGSLLPFGTLILDRGWKKEYEALKGE